ncbi:hypothetical protein DVW87_05480 [Sphingomonas aracearum]|uniref:LPXTG cell wall anchor domain-containing protein n=2 Tax=Sphingomonas aracearum TaxID=2283317 RepID=A0A369VXJ9_9SPHN|nr:hypothetical protein DVW87_05480 [Sphingomonas aracearum]
MLAGPAAAQNQSAPVIVPIPENFSLPGQAAPAPGPTATPTPAPVLSSSPTPRATPTPRASATPSPRPTSTPSPTPSPTQTPRAAASATPTPVPQEAPAPMESVTPLPAPLPGIPVEVQDAEPGTGWGGMALGGGLIVLLLAGGWWWLRRRRTGAETAGDDFAAAPIAPAEAEASPPPVAEDALELVERAPAPAPQRLERRAPAAPAPRLAFEFRPRRAGTNLTSAAVDYHIVVRNAGEGGAERVQVDIRLLTANRVQDAQLAALFGAALERVSVAPFDLGAGGEAVLDGMALLPREAVSAIGSAERPMFVPLIALNIAYVAGGADARAAAVWVIGRDRGEEQKLGAFRLDEVRMYEGVVAREYPVPR